MCIFALILRYFFIEKLPITEGSSDKNVTNAMNKMTLQGYTVQLFRTSSTAFSLVFLLFLTACHHKAASKQAKIDREKEKSFQIEQKEIADLKKEKKSNISLNLN